MSPISAPKMTGSEAGPVIHTSVANTIAKAAQQSVT